MKLWHAVHKETLLLVTIAITLCIIPASAIQPRLALVIGNSEYKDLPLTNPADDAKDMSQILEQLGFEVILRTNVNKRIMIDAIQEFGDRLQNGSVGLFYFSGHGVQSKNINYLLPLETTIRSEADIEFEAVDANRILAHMEAANHQGANLIFLDACRNNPFKGFAKSIQGGLAEMKSPVGSLIAYATAPNAVAFGDIQERNSVYTKYLLHTLHTRPEKSISDILIDVRKKVMQETDNQQVPWESVSLTEQFYFAETTLSNSESNTGWEEPTTGMKFIWIPEGCFTMGQSENDKQLLLQGVDLATYQTHYTDEVPSHQVCLDGFWIGKMEVTNKQYQTWDAEHNSGNYQDFSLNDQHQPVVQVTWNDANAFTEWLSSQHQNRTTFRLPTEAEWEYTCRSDGNSIDVNGLCKYANVADNTASRHFSWTSVAQCNDHYAVTSPVGSFLENDFGIYDSLGNVLEWCSDWYAAQYYTESPSRNPTGPTLGEEKVLRGGAWDSYGGNLRCSVRLWSDPAKKSILWGFRVNTRECNFSQSQERL